jgi:putative membrane protein
MRSIDDKRVLAICMQGTALLFSGSLAFATVADSNSAARGERIDEGAEVETYWDEDAAASVSNAATTEGERLRQDDDAWTASPDAIANPPEMEVGETEAGGSEIRLREEERITQEDEILTPTSDISAAPERTASSSQLSARDAEFLRGATHISFTELEHGQLAGQGSSNHKIQKFGSELWEDHVKHNQRLSELASKKGLQLPEQTGSASHQNHLAQLKGSSFDRMFLDHTIVDHEIALEKFREAARSADDPEVRRFAQESIPLLEEHLKNARELKRSELPN